MLKNRYWIYWKFERFTGLPLHIYISFWQRQSQNIKGTFLEAKPTNWNSSVTFYDETGANLLLCNCIYLTGCEILIICKWSFIDFKDLISDNFAFYFLARQKLISVKNTWSPGFQKSEGSQGLNWNIAMASKFCHFQWQRQNLRLWWSYCKASKVLSNSFTFLFISSGFSCPTD